VGNQVGSGPGEQKRRKALAARGPLGPRGFKSHPRRHQHYSNKPDPFINRVHTLWQYAKLERIAKQLLQKAKECIEKLQKIELKKERKIF